MTDDELRDLAKDLPWDRPDAARREAVRSQLLVAANEDEGRRPGTRWWHVGTGFVAGVAAAAAVILLVWSPRPQPAATTTATLDHAPRAAIEASSQANFEREVTASSTAGIAEVVHLHAGMLRLAVGTLPAAEHVRVETRTGVVEGAGDYEVAVAEDMLRTVTVHTGTATVTVDGRQVVILASGQTWTAPVVTAAIDVPNPSPNPNPTPTPDPSPNPNPQAVTRTPEAATRTPDAASRTPEAVSRTPDAASRTPEAVSRTPDAASRTPEAVSRTPDAATPTPSGSAAVAPAPTPAAQHAIVEQHFEAGYAALRANQPDAAATELAAAADADPSDPLAADARYLEGVALVQAHRPGEAEKALIAFLDRAPTSLRRGKAAVLLGRLIADRGDNRGARAWFASALHDADASVADAARAGIAALDRVSAPP